MGKRDTRTVVTRSRKKYKPRPESESDGSDMELELEMSSITRPKNSIKFSQGNEQDDLSDDDLELLKALDQQIAAESDRTGVSVKPKLRHDDTNDDDDDDNDAPEAVSFGVGKKLAIDSKRLEQDAILHEKQRIKDKRRKKDQLLKTQKKLTHPASMPVPEPLPDEILNSLQTEDFTARPVNTSKGHESHELPPALDEFEDDSDVAANQTEDFIPLDSGFYYKVVSLSRQQQLNSKSSLQKAQDFKREQFYGKRIRRHKKSRALISVQKKQAILSGSESRNTTHHGR